MPPEKGTISIITAIIGFSLNALATDNDKSTLDDVLDPHKYWKDLSEANEEEIAYEARQDARAVFPYVPFVFWSNNGWVEAAGVLATELILEKRHNLALNTRNRLIYDHQLYYDLFELTVIVSREHGKVDLDDLVIPPENTNSTLTTVPMPKEVQEQIDAEEAAKEQAKRKLFEKQEAEREANGDFSQAPGLTPEQREAAEIRWAEKNAKETIKGAKPYPQ